MNFLLLFLYLARPKKEKKKLEQQMDSSFRDF